ncbi:hypothetical protein Droror1_Dr00009932 [Drosera rotundifolia]
MKNIKPITVCLGKRAWVNSNLCSLRSGLVEIVRSVYRSEVEELGFEEKEEVAKKVNEWVANATKGLIDHVIQPEIITRDLALILANALYFKAKWAEPFQRSKMKMETFHLLNGGTIRSEFMKQGDRKNRYGCFEGYRVLEMPYVKNKSGETVSSYSMYNGAYTPM